MVTPLTRRRLLSLLLGSAPLLLRRTPPPALWTAALRHPGLQQPATLRAWDDVCLFGMRGSRPPDIRLPRRWRRAGPTGVVVYAYAGWPRRADGRITGVLNRSADPPGARWIEQKLGPTLVWAANGCRSLCVRSTLLQFTVTVQRSDDAIVVADVRTPTVECACLTPSFVSDEDAGRSGWRGAIDQPGATFADVGDMFTDLEGRRWQVVVGDRLHIDFRQRATLLADDVFVLDDDYSFALDATLGRPAYEIEPEL